MSRGARLEPRAPRWGPVVNFGDERLPERFWAKASPCPTTGCWLWTATLGRDGYGQVWGFRRRLEKSHRMAYEALVGPIPDGLECDHLCRVKSCCNPAHIEPVTGLENKHRSPAWAEVLRKRTRDQLARTSCKHGHPYTARNTAIVWRDGTARRACRACAAARSRRRYHEARA